MARMAADPPAPTSTSPPPVAGTLRMGTTRARWVLLTTVLGSGMVMVDATVVNVALGRIGADLGAGFAGLQWTVNAYVLTLASLILLGGSLGDRFGRRRMFLVGVVWFTAASLLCGLAPDIDVLIGARALQGVGGALLTPATLALISASFHGADRAAAVGAWSGLGGIAGAIGPFLGGWLVELSWRAAFLINLPMAVVVVLVAVRHVPESRDPEAARHLDVAGTALAVVGLSTLTFALTRAGAAGIDAVVLGTGAVGLAALAGFVVVERRSTHPLVPMQLFANRVFSAANAVTAVVYCALGSVFFLLVLDLQVVAGFSPVLAGSALLPVTALMVLLSARMGALAQRIGPRIPMTAGPLLAATALLLLTRVGPGASYLADVLPAMLVFGLGLALTVAPLIATVLDSADDRFAGTASGVNNAVARASGLLAVAVIPAVAGIGGAGVTDATVFASGFRTALLISAAMLVFGAALAATVIRRPLGGATAAAGVTHCDVAAPTVLVRR